VIRANVADGFALCVPETLAEASFSLSPIGVFMLSVKALLVHILLIFLLSVSRHLYRHLHLSVCFALPYF